MTTLFSKIIKGEIPARFVYKDDTCVAFLDVRPLARGHCLVVPRQEINHWTDLEVGIAAHLMKTAHAIGNAQKEVVESERIGLMIAGFEVPHVHVHVVPINTMRDLDFANADPYPDPKDLGHLRQQIASALSSAGHQGAQV